MKETLMRPIMILSLAVLATISDTNVVFSETVQQNSIEAVVLQIYHQKYEGQRRLAAAALARGDVEAAGKAATCANSSIFDGVAARFTPSADGVSVTLSRVEEGKPFQEVQLTLPQFNEWLSGNAGQYDNVMEKGTPNILLQVSKSGGRPIEQRALAQQPPLPIQSCVPVKRNVYALAAKPATPPTVVQSRFVAVRPIEPRKDQSAAIQLTPSFLDMSKVHDGPRLGWKPPPEPEDNMNTVRGIRAQANRSFPWASQSEERELWIASRMSEQLDREGGNSYSVRVNR
jgi:hypothetical protein